MKKLLLFLFVIFQFTLFSQGRLILTGNSFIVIDNSAKVVVENPNTNAILNTGSGGIITEAEFDQLIWKIGTNTGAYTVPFVGAVTNTQIPFTANFTGAGVGAGEVRFSTYPGPNWDNNVYRPSDVTHMFDYNTNSINNSLYVIDRFWIVDALSYTTKPNGTFDFTYIDAEHAFNGGNAIVEANLGAQRFHSGPNIWGDYLPQGTTNVAANTTTGVPVSTADFYRSWTLSLTTNPLFTAFKSISSNCNGGFLSIDWNLETSNQIDYFKINYIHNNGNTEYLGSILTSPSNNYTFQTNSYREGDFELVAVDYNGEETVITKIFANCKDENINSAFYSNGSIFINLSNQGNADEELSIFDTSGKLIKKINLELKDGSNQITIPFIDYSSGVYFIKTNNSNKLSEKIYKGN